MGREHWTPISIVVGSALIGLGLFFGLRERTVSAPGAPLVPSASPSTSASQGAPGSATPSAEMRDADPPPAASAAIDAEVKKATRALAKTLGDRCYAPHANDKEIPKHIVVTYSGSFDAKGFEVGRGFSETREGAYGPFSKCIRELPMDLRIAPPGKAISVVVPLELP